MSKEIEPLGVVTSPDGVRTAWYSGIHTSDEFPGARRVEIDLGYTGLETRVSYGFAPQAVGIINVLAESDFEEENLMGGQAAD